MGLHDTDIGVNPPGDGHHWIPRTRPARWGFGLGVVGFLLMPTWMLLGPLGAFPQLIAMAIGGGLSLFAIGWRRERAILAFIALLPLLLVLVFVIGELAAPH